MEEGMASDDFEFTAGDDTEAGQYAATLVSIERKETKEGDFFRVWHFKTVTGAELSGSSSLSSGPQSKAYRWARAIIGREPQPGERAGFLFGKGCIVEVKVNDAGFAKVVEVYPNATRPVTPQAAPAPAAPPPSSVCGRLTSDPLATRVGITGSSIYVRHGDGEQRPSVWVRTPGGAH